MVGGPGQVVHPVPGTLLPVREIRLLTESFPGEPDLDAAVSRALVEGVASGDEPETLRLYVPDRLVAFGSRDMMDPGYPAARRAAEATGFGSYRRLAGGRAAVFHEGTLAFAWAVPEPDPRTTIEPRFAAAAEVLVEALSALGVDARRGEVPGEYCPGTSSINAGGRTKLAGVGQRLVRGAAHVGGVLVVDGADLVNRALTPVYAALGFDWDPRVTGAVADEVATDVAEVSRTILGTVAARHRLIPANVGARTLDRARAHLR
jgi:lipoate-protein ligase A